MPRTHLATVALILATLGTGSLSGDPLSKQTDIDFYRDIRSRDLHGLATRSDGRLVAGPVLVDLKGDAPAELLWCLEPGADGRWLVGTGPNGRIFEVTIDPKGAAPASHEIAKLDDPQVFALRRLPDGSLLAGTSPKGGLCLIRGGKLVARVGLPADSLFDLALLPDGTVLAATGNPGRIYRVDVAKFGASGITHDRVSDPKGLAAHGISLFGEIRDRNVRRIARLTDGRIAAGSAPRGNVYLFEAAGGSPFILQDNRDAEVTDLLPDASGGCYATIIFSLAESRLASAAKGKDIVAETVQAVQAAQAAQPPTIEKFSGRSTLVWFPAGGFPETLTARLGVAFYRLARHGDTLLIAGGEQGEMSGYSLKDRLALTFSGSESSQINALQPVPNAPDRFVALRNNAPGFTVLDFAMGAARRAETRPVDLGALARLGALRFNRLRGIADGELTLSLSTSNGSDETEGWSPWVPLKDNDGWRASVPSGRYARVRFELPLTSSPTLELDKPTLYSLPQNHRPTLQEFRMLSPNYAIIVPVEQPASPTTTVSQLIQAGDSERHHSGFQSSQVVPSPGTRVAFWTVNDVDGDNLLYTFSIRPEGASTWTDISVDSREAYAQFDTAHLPEGTYFTRLVAKETAPRLEADRLSVNFETDDMVVDHTPPRILECGIRKEGNRLILTVHGRDALSLLHGIDVVFNNGVHETVEQPADGILDGREETFVLDESAGRVSSATSAEVTLYDSAGNGSVQRLSW